MNDLNHAMQSLKTAFIHRKNQNPGEGGDARSTPRPRPFQRFMKNDTFRNLVNDLTAHKEHERHKLKEGELKPLPVPSEGERTKNENGNTTGRRTRTRWDGWQG